VELQGFLRTSLKNSKIILDSVVEEVKNEDMMYTNKEKFDHLAKKYPALTELQQKLGLDPDY
jgi:DNA polymerase-3 subunit gamma/tau